jgi:predicted ATPase
LRSWNNFQLRNESGRLGRILTLTTSLCIQTVWSANSVVVQALAKRDQQDYACVAGRVTVTLLNGFAASVDGTPVPDAAWRLRKARELVKLLALAPGHRLHREQAMDILWQDRGPDAAANNLHQVVYVARRALGSSAIEVRDEMLSLHVDVDVDVDRLERAAADARRMRTPAAYRAARSIYAGELLPENRYDDWAEPRRDELAGLAVELDAELDAIGDSVDCLPPDLPVDPSSFIGRTRELGEMESLLRDTRLLTLTGAGGVGKTRLALELGRSVAACYPGGAAFVDLAALTNEALVLDAVAAALDVRALSGQELLDAVLEYIVPRSMVLIVDNCEHLLGEAVRIVDTFLRAAPELTVIATSREPLHARGEVVFRVPSLEIPDPELVREARELLEYEAVQLFVERAGAAAPGFELDGRNAADVARICLRLDGLPLALELAASRVGALGPTAVARRLDDRFRVLRSHSHASPTRQQTLTATLQWSHDLLEAGERALLRRLATFSGGFELDAVEAVCAGGELDAVDTADVFARLIEKSLVVTDDPTVDERRYRLLETVRLYALERLEEAGETRPLAHRHAVWARAIAHERKGSPRLDRDASNLRTALDTLLDRAPADALRLCLALLPFWMRRIDLGEARRRFDQVIAATPECAALRAQALLAAAAIEFRSGGVARAEMRARQSHAAATESGDPTLQWRALAFLGELALASDAADLAIPWLERAHTLACREGMAAAQATCIYSLGVADLMLGDLAGAETRLTQSVDRFTALAGSPERIPSLVSFAETSLPGSRCGVRVVFEDTVQPFAEIACEAAVGYVLANLAGIVRARGDLARSRVLLDQSAAWFGAADDPSGTSAVLVRRAYLALAEGALPAARCALEEALALRRKQRDRRGVGLVLAGLGLIDTAAGEYRSAEHHLAEAGDIFRRAGDRWGLASTLWRTADLALARGRVGEAEAALQEAQAVLGPTQRERWIANTLAALAEIALRRGDRELATALLLDARERYVARHDALGIADVDRRLRDVR